MRVLPKAFFHMAALCGLCGCKANPEQLCLLTVNISASSGVGTHTLVAHASGGVEPYSYNWNGSYEDYKEVTYNGTGDNGPGLHTVTVYDVSGCSAQASITVSFPCDNIYSVADVDGNTYTVLPVGDQCWLSDNLVVSAGIPQVTDSATWVNTTSPAWCYYNNDVANAAYGKLYNWYAVQSGNLCPEGWHIPTYEDWNQLETYLGDKPGLKMRAPYGWEGQTSTSGNSVFFADPSGWRSFSSSHFYGLMQTTGFWSSTQATDATAYYRGVSYDSDWLTNLPVSKRQGYSCRCVKD